MSRRAARESAFLLIFERITAGEKNALTLELLKKKTAEEAGYLDAVYNGVDEKLAFLTEAVARYSKGFSADRIYKADMSALLLAAFEILFMDDVPDRVAINEALELIKIYSTEKSSAFVNGILGGIADNKEAILAPPAEEEESESGEAEKV